MKLLILAFLILVGSCNHKNKVSDEQEVEVEEEIENITEPDYTILNFDPNWKWIFQDAQPTELSESEMRDVDEIINVAILDNNERQKENLKRHNEKYPEHPWTETRFELDLKDGYHRQYVPVLNEKGEKIVWVNFFCSTFNENWKKEIIKVHDGGNCFFNIKVNLTKKSYSELRINGYA